MGGGEESCLLNLTRCPPPLFQLYVNVDIGFGPRTSPCAYVGPLVGNPLTLVVLRECKCKRGEPGNELSVLLIIGVRYEKGVIVLPTYLRLVRIHYVSDMNPSTASAAFELGC